MSKITARVERKLGIPGLAERLADALTATELQSLLLDVGRRRSAGKSAPRVLAEYGANRFVAPSTVSPLGLAEWDRVAFGHLPKAFEVINLSPVAPAGTCAAVADVAQDWSIVTVRNTEVVSDSTNVLALESASRRRDVLRADPRSQAAVHLASSHRLVRPQAFDKPGFVPHFQLLGLTSAGRALGENRFELDCFETHLGFLHQALRAYLGDAVKLRFVALPFGSLANLADSIEGFLEGLAGGDAALEVVIDPEHEIGPAYYCGLRFQIDGVLADGSFIHLADGGVVDWTQRLLSNRKERLFISGLGSERLVMLLGPDV